MWDYYSGIKITSWLMSSKTYDFEKYSILDIAEFVREQGYSLEETLQGLQIVHTSIVIMYVAIDTAGQISAYIHMSRLKKEGEDPNQKKLYQKLVKKFGCDPKHEGNIKDKDKITIQDFRNKFFMKFV
jgi:hypothetical protein